MQLTRTASANLLAVGSAPGSRGRVVGPSPLTSGAVRPARAASGTGPQEDRPVACQSQGSPGYRPPATHQSAVGGTEAPSDGAQPKGAHGASRNAGYGSAGRLDPSFTSPQ
jgi:hypothetical protein